jgi:tetratricopeptide (TPR) repeat protein
VAFAQGLNHYRSGDEQEALTHFLSAAPDEPGAAILASAILLEQGRTPAYAQAEALLESVLESEAGLPTPLIDKYLSDSNLRVNITPHVEADVSVDGMAATLLLTEVYQARNKLDEAMDLLEAVQNQIHEPALTLSICELYAQREIWDGIVERANNIAVTDEVTFETLIWYGRAMQGKHLHEAAIAIFNDLLKLKKGIHPSLRHEAMYWRATSYQAMGKIAQANREFQKLYAKAPTFRDVAERVNQ